MSRLTAPRGVHESVHKGSLARLPALFVQKNRDPFRLHWALHCQAAIKRYRSFCLKLKWECSPPPLSSLGRPRAPLCAAGGPLATAPGRRVHAAGGLSLGGGVVGRGSLLHAQGRTRACWPEAVRGCGGGVSFVARGGSPGRGRCAPTGAGAAPATSCATCAAPTATNTTPGAARPPHPPRATSHGTVPPRRPPSPGTCTGPR